MEAETAYELAIPDPEAADVLVQIHAVAVKPLDIKIRDGEFKLILTYRLLYHARKPSRSMIVIPMCSIRNSAAPCSTCSA